MRIVRPSFSLQVAVLMLAVTLPAWAQRLTVGGGVGDPAIGPPPAHDVAAGQPFVLVKNWDFGRNGTIRHIADLNEHFQYRDQFGTFANGTKYGAFTVAPDSAHARSYNGIAQPIEGVNTDSPVREFTNDSLKTYLVPLDGADKVHPTEQKAGCGSFQAKWTLENGGSRLGRDLIWETRVRFKPVRYYWFAIWISGNKWRRGAEIDVVESFGYDNGGDYTNFDGRYWHSSPVGGTAETNYHKNWSGGMKKYGFTDFDPAEWHTWTLLYRADDTFTVFLDGKPVQNGTMHWTLGAQPDGEPLKMSFLLDGGWGHREVKSVNHWLPTDELKEAYYEWDYSRVYLSAGKQ